jgi:hypothetical protein
MTKKQEYMGFNPDNFLSADSAMTAALMASEGFCTISNHKGLGTKNCPDCKKKQNKVKAQKDGR